MDRGDRYVTDCRRTAVRAARTHRRRRQRHPARARESGGAEIAASSSPGSGSDLSRLFSPDGPLAKTVTGFRARPFQLEMAEAVAEAIAGNGVLVAEAGTGTGNTY